MQIGISSYSYSRLVRTGKASQLEIIAMAKEDGFDTIEFSTIAVPEGETLPGFAVKIREECDRVGFDIANYTIGADFLNGSGGNLEAEIERVKKEVDIAHILKARGMRHDATQGFPKDKIGARSFDDALPRLIEGCREVSVYAEQFGIKTMVENHGYFSQDSPRLEKLVCGVNHPNFGLLIDMGNFICADDDPGRAIGLLMPYAIHVHAKDFHLKSGSCPDPGAGWHKTRGGNFFRGSIIGHGDIQLIQCLRVMRAAGYEGVLSIEYEGIEDVREAIGISLANLRSYVSQVYG